MAAFLLASQWEPGSKIIRCQLIKSVNWSNPFAIVVTITATQPHKSKPVER